MDHNLICYPNTQTLIGQQWGSNKRCLHKSTKRNGERFTEIITTLGKNKKKENDLYRWFRNVKEMKRPEMRSSGRLPPQVRQESEDTTRNRILVEYNLYVLCCVVVLGLCELGWWLLRVESWEWERKGKSKRISTEKWSHDVNVCMDWWRGFKSYNIAY